MGTQKIIKNGTIVTDTKIFKADILINDDRISEIDTNLLYQDAEIIDATGQYIFPGGIDPHTHFDLPVSGTVSKDDFYSGTVAAACGGTTTIIDFCTPLKGQPLQAALEVWHQKACGKAVIDYGFHIALVEVNHKILEEMAELSHNGYPSYKVYMTYDIRLSDHEIMQVLQHAKQCDGLILVHAELHEAIQKRIESFKQAGKTEPLYHPLSRPPFVESEATQQVIQLNQEIRTPLYIVHLTCDESLQFVRQARQKQLPIMAETCIQYLTLSEERYELPNFESAKYVISPPLRAKTNFDKLWKGLANNTLQVVSTDHCSFNFTGQKERGRNFFGDIPNGIPSVEVRLPLIFDCGVNTGKSSLNRFVEITSTNPAKIFGLYPRKGSIAVGSDADLVLFDPKLKKTIHHEMLHDQVDYTPYEGFTVTGYPTMTICRGKIIVKDGEFIGQSGYGSFIARKKPILI